MEVKKRVALVTGAARGIGAGIAQRLAADGLTVAIADLDPKAAEATAASLPGSGHRGYAVDVRDEALVKALFDTVEADFGPLAVLVANAGVLLLREGGVRPLIVDTTLDEWEQSHAVNTRGTFLCTREMLRRRTAQPVADARVVTLSSVAAQLGGYRSSSAYISSKSAVLGFTKAAAREAAPLGLTVNCVAPGLIDAPMLRLSLPPEKDVDVKGSIPLNRIGTPEDVAQAVSFLVSPASSYLTGIVIDVNGGYRMQ
ncbi:SDR family NAD(P)-dependent oxidoreductase [Ferrovibrio sp.]|uniref:SDR family NAD(P)-dependent oxidoreductase n=1 Tax=Ferrovibrio sp. TaxID=1917215 RepID=UPI0035B32737